MVLREIVFEVWTRLLTQYRDNQWALMNTVMTF